MAGIAKSTTTPNHKTTLYTVGLTKGFYSPHRRVKSSMWLNLSTDQLHEQCSHTKCIKRIRDLFEYALYKFTLYLLTYLHHPHHASEPDGANESPRRVSKPERKIVVSNYSAFGIC